MENRRVQREGYKEKEAGIIAMRGSGYMTQSKFQTSYIFTGGFV